MTFLYLQANQTLNDIWIVNNGQFINVPFLSLNSVFQSKSQPFFLAEVFRSLVCIVLISVGKLSPAITFSIDRVSLSTIKSRPNLSCSINSKIQIRRDNINRNEIDSSQPKTVSGHRTTNVFIISRLFAIIS